MSNMKSSPQVIFYGYLTGMACSQGAKIENVLAYKGIPHNRVEVAMTLPRPEITDALGIGYRRIPVLAIGNDVYCDTSLIASALEHHFPASQGFPTLYPKRKGSSNADTGMIEALSTFYADRALFGLATLALPYSRFSKDFIEDRNKLFGSQMDVEKTMARQPLVRSLLGSHMTLLEKQLADGREWMFDTVAPGYGDFALYGVFGWVIRFKMKEIFTKEKFPQSTSWMNKMADLVKSTREANAPAINKINGTVAAKIIAENAGSQSNKVDFDQDEAKLLGLKRGEEVQVVPDDSGRNFPTIGNIVGLSREEIVLQLKGSAVPSLRCHFPRLNYSVSQSAGPSSKL